MGDRPRYCGRDEAVGRCAVSARRALVVGAGLGGLRAAEALRGHGFDGEIVLVGDEPWEPYSRPPLSKEALAARVDHARLAFPRKDAGLSWRLSTLVAGADLDARTVVLDDGERIDYDVLVAATGVRPRRISATPSPPEQGGRFVVRTLHDAAALRERLVPGARLVIVGAGFIGCEVAATARRLGAEVDVVALDSYPMVRPLGESLAAELQRRHERHGVSFHLGRGIAAIEGTGRVARVRLDDGTVLVSDVVVEAIGSAPRSEWLAGNGLDLSDGVLVDGALRPLVGGVPVDGVAVVGDLVRYPNPRFGPGSWRVEHWSNPTDTGRRAGEVLAALLSEGRVSARYADAVAAPFAPLPSFWSDQYDLTLQSFGLPSLADPDGVRVLEGDLADECVVGYHRGADLMGVVGIGMLRRVASYRSELGVGRRA
jgi:NADPH-dependent 2,4-dienoyl-CoA reductase/sulfur reductase-like enzyme